jgi:hypothetical protein
MKSRFYQEIHGLHAQWIGPKILRGVGYTSKMQQPDHAGGTEGALSEDSNKTT